MDIELLKQKAKYFDEIFEIVNEFKNGEISLGEYIDYILNMVEN